MALGTSLHRLSHKTTHTRELLDLVLRTTGTRVEHHEYGVEALVGLCHLLHKDACEVVVHVSPGIDHLVVTLVLSDEAHVIVVLDGANLFVTALHDFLLFWRDDDIVEVERKTCNVSHTVTEVLDAVEELAGTSHTYSLDYVGDESAQSLLRDDIVEEAYFLWDDLVDDDTSYRCLHHALLELAVHYVLHDYLNRSVEVALALVVSNDSFLVAVERKARALCTRTELCDVVETEHHIL